MEVTQKLVDQIMMLYDKKYDADTFNFDMLMGPHIYQILPPHIVEHIHQYIIDPKNSSDTGKKILYIDRVLKPYGLVRFAAGTNRAVYKYMEDQSFCVKVALDKTGLTNNPDEFKNQQFLKPFVNKIFSVSPCGTFATCERVIPIRSRQEFAAVAGDIFDVIANKFIGKYILEDIGTIWFKNWGIRGGFGPVLLDYPYLYEVDINRLFCNDMTPLGLPCGGQIDYDTGFNILYCTRCGKRHKAKQIGKAIKEKLITYKGGNGMSLKIIVKKGDKVIVDKTRADNHIDPNEVLKSQIPSTTMTRVIPKGGDYWRKEDFNLIITINGIKFGKKDGKYIKLGQSKAKAAVKTNGAQENPYRGVCTNVKPKVSNNTTENPPSWYKSDDQVQRPASNPTCIKKTISMNWFNTRPVHTVVQTNVENLNLGFKVVKHAINEEVANTEREQMLETAKEIKSSIENTNSISGNVDESVDAILNKSNAVDINSEEDNTREIETEQNEEISNDDIRREVAEAHEEEFDATIKHFDLNREDFVRSSDKDNFDTPDISDF